MFVSITLPTLGIVLLALMALRLWDWRAERIEWARLAALQPVNPVLYDPGMVAELPEPVRRFFNFTIKPGARLLTVAEIEMGGQFSLGSREQPAFRPMIARQILAAPTGFLWKLRLPGLVPVSGSDSGRWTRFRILGLIPVARMGGDPDHTRSAFGRYVAEAVIWSPAALLPGPGIVWSQVNQDTARVTVSYGGLSQAVDVELEGDGRPVVVRFMRWSNANPEKKHRLQPFGARASDFREVQGFRIPLHIEAATMFGTDEQFVFFKAEVVAVNFVTPGS